MTTVVKAANLKIRSLGIYGINPILARIYSILRKTESWNGFLEHAKDKDLLFLHSGSLSNWHNDRPHGSLNFQGLETPETTFRRKMPLEAYFGMVIDC